MLGVNNRGGRALLYQAFVDSLLGIAYPRHMKAATVSSKGQVTIPAELIRRLGIEPGSRLLVVPVEGGILLLRRVESLAEELAGSTSDVYGTATEYLEAERGEWS